MSNLRLLDPTFGDNFDVDVAKVQATYADGVLSLELPKKSQGDARKISIQ